MTASVSVEQFVKKPHKKYSCGKKAVAAKQALSNAFVGGSKETEAEEKQKFDRALDVIMQTKKGCEVMSAVSKLGYTFAFENTGLGGGCMPSKKKIVIDPKAGFNDVLRAVVHESIHALQASNEKGKHPDRECLQASSMLMKYRAIEADASAHEAAFIHQLPPQYREESFEKRNPMVQAYGTEIAASGDEKKAMQASFKAWYDYDYYRDFYDASHRAYVQKAASVAVENKADYFFKDELSAKQIASICQYKGKPYINPEFLESGKAFSVPMTDKAVMTAAAEDYASKVKGVPLDSSLKRMYVRDFTGQIRPPEKRNGAKTVVSAVKQQRIRG